MSNNHEPSSFRDPDGYVYYENGQCLRAVRQSYKENYELLIKSGLFNKLLEENLVIPFCEISNLRNDPNIYKTLRPVMLDFISFPYEWSFDQVKDTALICLKIQRIALDYGMTLKDATPYNFQLFESTPTLIDTLSFEKYREGEPWIPYYQFCKNFLLPIFLMSRIDTSMNRLLETHISGIPLKVASKYFKLKDAFNIGLLMHIKLQYYFESRNKTLKNNAKIKKAMSKTALLGLIDNLESTIKKLKLKGEKSAWDNYYSDENCLDLNYLSQKKLVVEKILSEVQFNSAIDLGANEGLFSRILKTKCSHVIAIDSDHDSVNKIYTKNSIEKLKNIHPLVVDIFNPSPAIGWANKERASLLSRLSGEMVCALALIHHLVINNNLTFGMLSELFLSLTTKYLLLEFVPKDDSNTQLLLTHKKDIYDYYTEELFEKTFLENFNIVHKIALQNSQRIIYLFNKK